MLVVSTQRNHTPFFHEYIPLLLVGSHPDTPFNSIQTHFDNPVGHSKKKIAPFKNQYPDQTLDLLPQRRPQTWNIQQHAFRKSWFSLAEKSFP